MDKNITGKNRRNYLIVMVSPFWVYLIVTATFFVFGQDLNSLNDVIGTLGFLFFWNVVLTGGIALGLYQGFAKSLKENPQKTPKALGKLIKKSRLAVLIIGLVYVSIISTLGYAEQPESYSKINEVLDFSLSIIFSYVVIPVFFLSVLLENWSVGVRSRLSESMGLEFTPGKALLRNELLGAFLILSLLPLGSVYVNLWSLGLWKVILEKDPYMISYGIIVLLGVALIILSKTRALAVPLFLLSKGVEAIRRGNFSLRVPVTVENELGHLAEKINDMAEGLEEREKMREVFGKVVDPSVRDRLLARKEALGGELQELTILFCDLRDFTVLSETRSPGEVVYLLNLYFDRMSSCIQGRGGVINKYIGDAIMAIFGLEGDQNQSSKAILAATDMQKSLADLNKELKSSGHPILQAGIGIHRSKVIAGTIGSESRMEFTVIGDGVNLASRIESLTKEFADGPVISRQTYDKLTEDEKSLFFIRPLLETKVKGKTQSVELMEVLDGFPLDQTLVLKKINDDYLLARKKYTEGFLVETEEILDRLLQVRPEDKIFNFWLEEVHKKIR